MTERDPDDISHLDFDVEDPELVSAPPPGDPRDWAPSEDVDDGTWVLNETDRELQDRLAWKRYIQLRRARWAGAILAIALLAVSISAFLNHAGKDDGDTPIQQADIDNAPTSAQMASYLPDEAAIEAIAPVLELAPGNTGGSYDNLSFDELDAGGPSTASYSADAGVVQRWSASDGRELTIAIYLFEDGTAAETAETVALADALEAGGQETAQHRFRLVSTAGSTQRTIATRVLTRFLITFEVTGGVDDGTSSDLLAAVSDASAAVH